MHEPANSETNILKPAADSPKTVPPRLSFAGSCGAAGSYIVRRMGFTKLDEGILQSSIMHEDGNTFKVWIILLAACKEDGIAKVSAIFISSISGIDITSVDKCLEKLSSPDKHSRSINDDGRRVERIDGGYKIINYQKYRNYTYSGTKEAAKKRKQRERNNNELDISEGTNKGHIPIGGGHSASASASASASGIQDRGKGKEDKIWKNDFPTFQSECDAAYNNLVLDKEWIAGRQKYHPRLNIKLSVEKAWSDFWRTEAGWKNKKASRSKEINWKATFNTALTFKSNQVWQEGNNDGREYRKL